MANRYAPLIDRFWSKVDPCRTDGCMIWLGAHQTAGYGIIAVNGHNRPAAQVSIELATGIPFPKGMEPDHLCMTPPCVAPEHLEVVTPRINKLRSNGASAQAARRTHCPQGHAYDLLNTWIDKAGSRHCRACWNARSRLAEEALLRGGEQ